MKHLRRLGVGLLVVVVVSGVVGVICASGYGVPIAVSAIVLGCAYGLGFEIEWAKEMQKTYEERRFKGCNR